MNNTLSRPVQVALPAAVASSIGSSAYVIPAPILPNGVGVSVSGGLGGVGVGGGSLCASLPPPPTSPSMSVGHGHAHARPVPIQSRPPPSASHSHIAPALPPSIRTSVPSVVEAHPNVLFVPPPGEKGGSVVSQRPVAEFLFHLMKMLTDPNIRHLIEWSDGRIRVHDPHALENDVLGKYFRHSKYSSFQRQLNYFGFRKVGSKGRMSPCCFVNESCTGSLASILAIKRRTATKARKQADAAGAAAATAVVATATKKRKDRSASITSEGEEEGENRNQNQQESSSSPSPAKKLQKKAKDEPKPLALAAVSNLPFAVTADPNEFGPPGCLNLPPAVSPISSAAASISAGSGYQTDGESTQASSLPSLPPVGATAVPLQPILPATAAAARLIASNNTAYSSFVNAASATGAMNHQQLNGNSWENLDGAQSEKDTQQQQQDAAEAEDEEGCSGPNDTATLAMIDEYLGNVNVPGGDSSSGAEDSESGSDGSNVNAGASQVDLAALATELGFGTATPLLQSHADLTKAAATAAGASSSEGASAPPPSAQQVLTAAAASVAQQQQQSLAATMSPAGPAGQRIMYAAAAAANPLLLQQQQPQQQQPQAVAAAIGAVAPPPLSCPVTPKLHSLLKSRSSQDFMKDFFDTFQTSPYLTTPSLLGQTPVPAVAPAQAQLGQQGQGQQGHHSHHILDNVKLPNLMQ